MEIGVTPRLQKTLFAVMEKSLDELHYLGEQYAEGVPSNVHAELETARNALVKVAGFQCLTERLLQNRLNLNPRNVHCNLF